VQQLGLECGKSIDELAQEAFNKPATLKGAWKQSTRLLPANDPTPTRYQSRR